VGVKIDKADSYTEASPGSVTVVIKNNTNRPVGLVSVQLAVGELRLEKTFTNFPKVTYDENAGQATTVFAEGVEDIGPEARMPLKYVQWVGPSDGVLIERVLLPGDEMTVPFDVTPYPKMGDRAAATAELIVLGECYKRTHGSHTTQNVTRPDPGGNPTPFIETTTTEYFERMRRPLGMGEYLITREAFDENPRVTAKGKTRLTIEPLPFTLAAAVKKAGFEPERFFYFHPGNIWLFCKDKATTFVSADVLETHPGDYLILAGAFEKNGNKAEVEVFDEIKNGTAPLLGCLFDGGYTSSKTGIREPGAAEGVWHLSKAMDSLKGFVTIKEGNLLRLARDLDGWGYRVDGARIAKK
jgi:predicted RecA/RadA family phage recombinase